jgi:hypothetical protein
VEEMPVDVEALDSAKSTVLRYLETTKWTT